MAAKLFKTVETEQKKKKLNYVACLGTEDKLCSIIHNFLSNY